MSHNQSCLSEREQWRLRDQIAEGDLKFLKWSGKGFVAAVGREKLDEVKTAANLNRMTVSDTRLVRYTRDADDDLFSGFYHSATGGKPTGGEPIYLLEAQIDFIPPTHVLALNTWGGTRYYAVEVIGATRSRTRVQMLQDVTLPGVIYHFETSH